MPVLGGLLVNLFGGMVAWLLNYVSRKVAYGIAAVTMMGSLTIGLLLVMRAALSATLAVSSGAPSIFLEAVAIGVPPAAGFCLSTYVTVWTACTAYTWQRDLIHLAIKA